MTGEGFFLLLEVDIIPVVFIPVLDISLIQYEMEFSQSLQHKLLSVHKNGVTPI